MKKIIITNFFILSALIILGEIIFGNWFKSDNFGIHLRGHINAKVRVETFENGIKKEFIFFRNSNAFRNYEIDNKEIDVVFVGGSTTIQSYLPYEETIVGILNQLFKNKKILFVNAGMEGKSTYGYLCDFKYWFSKINDLNPKYYIFYTGYNDTFNKENSKKIECEGITSRDSNLKKLSDYLINTSFILSNLKIIKHELFQNKLTFEINDGKKERYITFQEAKKKFGNKKNNDPVILNYKLNLRRLEKIFKEKKITPIFITQVSMRGNDNKLLYLINKETKSFANKNGYLVLKLDEEIDLKSQDFYDYIHNNARGSEKIAYYIYNKIYDLF